jgi:hypothetical protein
MESGPPFVTFPATDSMCVIIAEPVTDLAIRGALGWAKRPIVIGFFAVVSNESPLIGANDPDGLDNPLPKLLIEAPHQVADGISEHPHESG